MKKLLLTTALLLNIAIPTNAAESLLKEFHGVRWGTSYAQTLATMQREFRYEKRQGTWDILKGTFAGYNVEFWLPRHRFTFAAIWIDSQRNQTSADIWQRLRELLIGKYGTPSYAYGDSSENTWEAAPTDDDEATGKWHEFQSGNCDAQAEWLIDNTIEIRLQTMRNSSSQRMVSLFYKHTPYNDARLAAEDSAAASDL